MPGVTPPHLVTERGLLLELSVTDSVPVSPVGQPRQPHPSFPTRRESAMERGRSFEERVLWNTEGVLTSFSPCVAAITQTIKCSHERSVHLFIDSLLHPSQQSTAYQCGDMDRFSQGLCLSCRKGRCSSLGYHVRQQPQGQKNKRLFLATRAQSPFKGECGWPPGQPLSQRLALLSVVLKPQIPDGDVHTASLSLSLFPRVCPPGHQVPGGETLILSETIIG